MAYHCTFLSWAWWPCLIWAWPHFWPDLPVLPQWSFYPYLVHVFLGLIHIQLITIAGLFLTLFFLPARFWIDVWITPSNYCDFISLIMFSRSWLRLLYLKYSLSLDTLIYITMFYCLHSQCKFYIATYYLFASQLNMFAKIL